MNKNFVIEKVDRYALENMTRRAMEQIGASEEFGRYTECCYTKLDPSYSPLFGESVDYSLSFDET